MNADQHSRIGLTSLALSVGMGLAFAGLLPGTRRYIEAEANELIEAPGTGLMLLLIVAVLLIVNLLALMFGVAGVF